MKKHQLWIGAFVLLLGTSIYAQDISIYMNSKRVEMDVTPEIKRNTTYVSISFISKELGANVKWESPKVIITKGNDQIIYTIGKKVVYKNGIQVQLLEVPYTLNDRTFVSLRSISELLNCKVNYQKESYRIDIQPVTIEEWMKKFRPLDYCITEDWIYYVTLGDQEGFHKRSLDGKEDIIISDLSKLKSIDGSTSVTSEYHETYILYKVQQLRQYDSDGILELPYPIYYYKLNLSDNTLEAITKTYNEGNKIPATMLPGTVLYFDETGKGMIVKEGQLKSSSNQVVNPNNEATEGLEEEDLFIEQIHEEAKNYPNYVMESNSDIIPCTYVLYASDGKISRIYTKEEYKELMK